MKRSSEHGLLSYFNKIPRSEIPNPRPTSPPAAQGPQQPSTSTAQTSTSTAQASTSTAQASTSTAQGEKTVLRNDIGKFADSPPKNDEELLNALKDTWTPSPFYSFPSSIEGRKNLKLNTRWMEKYTWLAYSDEKKGAFCKMCVLFGRQQAGRGDQQLGVLVTQPLTKWKHALESFKKHEKNLYHKLSVEQAQNFVAVMTGRSKNVLSSLDEEYNRTAAENRKKITAIVETIVLCGRQELPLRGKDEGGMIGITEPYHNDGNFRALLRFRARSGDEYLKAHLESQTHDSRSMYTSPSIQNEIITLCGNFIQDKLVERILNARCFSVLADETTDISRHQQLALCVRYVDTANAQKETIREDFLEFVHVKDVSADSLASTIVDRLLSLGLDLENELVGQGYDGAAVMSGRFKGVRSLINEKYPKAHFVHCAAHTLNLVLAHSCEVSMIRNCIGVVKSIVTFFRSSPLRDGFLKEQAVQMEAPHENLIRLCETRWTEKHLAVHRFVEMYSVVCETLEQLQNSDREFSSQAFSLRKTIESSQFIVALLVLKKIFSYTTNLNKYLQSVDVDLAQCCDYVETITSSLQDIRNSEEFGMLFKEASAMSPSGEIKSPRTTERQSSRSNVPATTPEEYYKLNVYYPFLDHVLGELRSRFAQHHKNIHGLRALLPKSTAIEASSELLKNLQETYLAQDSFEDFSVEYRMWRKKWQTSTTEKPATALEAIDHCEEMFFPKIKFLLEVLVTLPVSTATPERTFSTLKRLKNYLRNATGQDRLTGLALLSTNREILVETENIINRLYARRSRHNIIV